MNIIGEGLNETISEQIRTRQKVYGSKNRTVEQLEYLNSRTAFAKLISSVNVEPTFDPSSSELKAIKGRIGGNNLAKDFVLFNGTQDADTNRGRAGLARDGSYINNAAYGLGGLEFGPRPMPGIISADVKTENRGSLRTTTIQIKAWNRVQFEIIDLLYLRLGYSVLFEFGNAIYFQNDGTLIKNKPWSLEDTFLAGRYTVQTILSRIQEIRILSNGNYDAVFGKVVNFSWEFKEDGSYDITVIIRSIGDVIESLKTNVLVTDTTPQSEENPPSDPPEKPTIESYADKHQIGKLLSNAKKALALEPISSGGCRAISTSTFLSEYPGALLKDIEGIAGKKHFLQQDYVGGDSQYYIRLGSFLAFLENKVIPKYTKVGGDKEPILKFDYADNNYIYRAPAQISMDPRVCLINTSISYSPSNNTYKYASAGEEYTIDIGGVKVGQVMNIYVNFMYILTTIDSNLDSTNRCVLIDLLKSLLSGISNAIGSINTLEPFIEEETNTVKIIDQSTIPGKYDLLQALNLNNPDNTVMLNLYGYYNTINGSSAGFVKQFGIKTEITPGLATMLSIGAQAAGSVVGEDATALSNLNKGLIDRVKNEVVDAVVESSPSQSKTEELETRFPNASKNFVNASQQFGSFGGATPTWNEQNIDSYSQVQTEFFDYTNAKSAITKNTSSPTMGFIPISLNLTLDGLSGMKIYNALRVDTSYLPSNYPTSMDFIITGLNHTISNNVWTTNLTTNMIPKDPAAGSGNSTTSTNPSTSGNPPTPPPRGASRGRWPYYSDSDSVPSDIESPSKGTPPTNTSSVSLNSTIRTKYIPELNSIGGYTKGLKLLAAVMTQKEGFNPKTRSYRTNNPGNIGNTDSGANNTFKTLKEGIEGQLSYLQKVTNGSHKAYPVGKNKDIKPYYSPEIDKNQKSYQLTPYLPGYKFTPYTGTLEQFVKIYATGARGGNSYLTTIMSFFKKNGFEITEKTTLAEISKLNNQSLIIG